MNVLSLSEEVVSLKRKCADHPISDLGDSNCLYCHDGNRLLDPVLKFMKNNFESGSSTYRVYVAEIQERILLIMQRNLMHYCKCCSFDCCQYCVPQGCYNTLFPFIESVVEMLVSSTNSDNQKKILETFASLMEVMKSIEPNAKAVYTFLTKYLFAYTYFYDPQTTNSFSYMELLSQKISESRTFEEDFTTFEEALLKKISGK
jgi:hypothetical protein